MKFILAVLAALISGTAAAQAGVATTNRLVMQAPGSQMDSTLLRGSSVVGVLAAGTFTAPGKVCATNVTTTAPTIYQGSGGYSLFTHDLVNYSYPDIVTISKLTVQACLSVQGRVYEDLTVRLVYRNKGTGQTYESQEILRVAGPVSPIVAIDYTSSANAYASAVFTWDLVASGVPTISSWDVSKGDIELGFTVRPVYNVYPRTLPYTDAVKIHGLDIRAVVPTFRTAPLQPSRATLAYDASPTSWAARRVVVSGSQLTPYTSGCGTSYFVLCPDSGNFVRILDRPWGYPNLTNYSITNGFILNKCGTFPQNGITRFRSYALCGANTIGDTSDSNSLVLY